MTFPDEPNLRSVATALWDGTPLGRASVMVGAGFSRNALPVSASVASKKPFPGWGELTESMARELYASPDESLLLQKALHSASSTSGALRIADEYQAWKGRGKLDALLRKAIPDDEFMPGPLHNLLFKLPWSDVLTTNFDTLLERAAAEEIDRQYSVVRSQADVPGSTKPRVVKLHGSFPDTKPFIITEDDFRTYDQTNPVMVNLVQQCFVENTCCLIGFSGDDPNFLRWTGWVRDILGPTHMEPVYLVGLLNQTPARRALLERRYVRSIDLAPLFPEDEWPNVEMRHRAATDWFLRALLHLRPTEFHDWPSQTVMALANAQFEDSPALPSHEDNSLIQESSHPSHIELPDEADEAVSHEAFLGLTPDEQVVAAQSMLSAISARGAGPLLHRRIDVVMTVWGHNRRRFPGWLIIPWPNRNTLEATTLGWVDGITTAVSAVEKSRAVEWLFELQWRLEKSLTSWPDKLTSVVETLLNPQGLVEMTTDHHQAEMVRTLAVQLLRSYRESGRHDDFHRWFDIISPLVRDHPDHEAFSLHQLALSLLEEWQVEKAEALLLNWNVDGRDPIWRVRKAALLGELGNRTAFDEATRALKEVQRSGARDEVAARTREEAALWLAGVLTPTFSPERRKLDARRHELRRKGFTSSLFAEQLTSRVAGSAAGFSEALERVGERGPSAVDAAFLIRRYVEDTGALLRRPGVIAEGALVSNAVPWMAKKAPLSAMRLSVRNRGSGGKFALLDLSDLARIPSESLQPIFQGIKEAIPSLSKQLRRFAGERQHGHILYGTEEYTPAERINWLLKSALSHLKDMSPVLDEAQLQDAVKVCFAFRSEWIAGQWQTWEQIETTLSALLSQCADETVLRLLPDILEQPVVGVDTKGESRTINHDVVAQSCLRLFRVRPKAVVVRAKRIDEMFSALSSNIDLGSKGRVVMRLIAASHWGLLDGDMERSLSARVAEILASTNAIGATASLKNFLSSQDLLLIPSAGGLGFRLRMVQAIASSEWIPQVSKHTDGRVRSISMGTGSEDPIVLASALTADPWIKNGWQLSADEWDRNQVLALLGKAEDWMLDEGLYLLQHQAEHEAGLYSARAQAIVDFCRKVALPKHDDKEIAERSAALLGTIRENGLITVSAIGVLIAGLPEFSADDASIEMRKAASSLQPSSSFAFLIGLMALLSVANDSGLSPPAEDLVHEVAIAVRGRRAPDLKWAIQIADIILKQYPMMADERFRRDISVGLQYLAVETDVNAPTLNSSQQQGTLEEIRRSSVALAATLQAFPEGREVALAWIPRQKFETVRKIGAAYGRLAAAFQDTD